MVSTALPLMTILLHMLKRGEGKISIDGQWSPWSTIKGFCVEKNNRQNLVFCGGGVERKFRSCTNPSPQGGGRTCTPLQQGGLTITDRQDFPCNENPCGLPEQFMWSEWSECSHRCGKGEQRRYKMCGSIRRRLPGMLDCHKNQATTTTSSPIKIPPSTIATTTTSTTENTATTVTEAQDTTVLSTVTPSATTTMVTTTFVTTTTDNPTTTSILTTDLTTKDSTVSTQSDTTDVNQVTTSAPQVTSRKGCENKCGCKTFKPEDWVKFWELELSEACEVQPDPVFAKYPNDNYTEPLLNPVEATLRPCNTWRYYGPDGYPDLWNHTNCPDPCLTFSCPKYAKCLTSSSSKEDMILECSCQMGMVMKDDNSSCMVPPPTTPTPRPIPTMEPTTKKVIGAVSGTASTILIILVSVSFGIFLVFRIFDPARVIHMCEEISLLVAHVCLLGKFHNDNCIDMPEEDQLYCEPLPGCRIVSIIIHYCFTVCFMFMFLEAVHMYGFVASVVKHRGILATKQNIFIGWGIPAFIILFNMCFEYDNYGSSYHCWLEMDSGLMYGQYVPIVCLVVTTFTLIEAAGASDDYPTLEGTDEMDKTTAQISQRTLLIILPLVFASYVIGTIATFEQNPALYGAFTIINGVLGGIVLFFHVTSNVKTRELVTKIKKKIFPGKGKSKE